MTGASFGTGWLADRLGVRPLPITLPQTAVVVPMAATSGVEKMASPAGTRRSALMARLSQLFEEVSGVELAESDASASFLELGLDSLTLTQVAQQLQKAFRVKVRGCGCKGKPLYD